MAHLPSSLLHVTSLDTHFADLVRSTGKSTILLANKAEGKAGEPGFYEAFSLGLGEPVAFSAEHGLGLDDLYDRLFDAPVAAQKPRPRRGKKNRPKPPHDRGDAQEGGDQETEDPNRPLRLAIVGRPNAGKSTLINRLIGQERLLTGPEAGITRDSISLDWAWQDKPIKLWDTAGMRKRARVTSKLEKLSVADGLRAVKFAEVVVILLDATQAMEKQDLSIANLIAKEGRAPVVAINKWDLVTNKRELRAEIEADISRLLTHLRGLPVVYLSGLKGTGAGKLMPAVMRAYEIWNRRIPTAQLNRWLDFQLQHHPPPAPSGRRIKIRYITQARARPPTFAVFCSNAANLPESYERYLINGLRADFDLAGVPIRLNFRQGKNPYVS